jgi:ABC-type transport system involved in multi-copper enzyme maturation permease subunit
MNEPRRSRRIPVLGCIGRTARLTWVEITKLIAHKFFLFTILMTLAVTVLLGFVGKSFSEGRTNIRFSNYSLWVVTASFGLQIATILLVAQGAMAMSSEATSRTLNTILCRPIRRIEFAVAKALSLVFATLVIVGATGLAGFIVGGTVQDTPRSSRGMILEISGSRRPASEAGEPDEEHPEPPPRRAGFPTYGDVVDPDFPDLVISPKWEVLGNISFGFLLLVVPVLAAAAVGFFLGTLLDSSALATGLSVGIFLTLEATKFFAPFEEYLGRYAYNYPINRLFTLMREIGNGAEVDWKDALGGVEASAVYIVVFFLVSFIVFCRRDVTL